MDRYIKEIEDVRNNIMNLERMLDGSLFNQPFNSNFAMKNWMRKKPDCRYYSPKVVKELCEKPGTLKSAIFEPMKKWLFDYEINLRQNIQGFDLDALLRRGIRVIYNFTMVAFFFAKNPDYFAPIESFKDSKLWILDLIGELDNCSSKLNFIYDRLNKIVKLPDDLAKMRKDIGEMCISLKLEKLRT